MNEEIFNEKLILAPNIDSIGKIEIEEYPTRLTITDALAPFSFKARKRFNRLAKEFEEELEKGRIGKEEYKLEMRLKSPGSIFFHALINNFMLPEMIDIYGFRFLTKRLEGVYDIANILINKYGLAECSSHEWFETERRGFMDWIKNPRPNGFRSLEYFLKTEGEHPTNIQGRTFKIEEEIEKGLAAHKFYKKGQLTKFQTRCLEDKDFRRQKRAHAKKLIKSFLESYYNQSNV